MGDKKYTDQANTIRIISLISLPTPDFLVFDFIKSPAVKDCDLMIANEIAEIKNY